MKSNHLPKIALVYDKVNTWGGAERVLMALHEIFPDAPLYTSVYKDQPLRRGDPRGRPNLGQAQGLPLHPPTHWAQIFPQIIPSFLQNLPFAKSHNQWYTPLMPLAFESLNLDQFDIVISITSGEAKGIITKPHTLHLCYCLTPTRYLWSDPGYNSYTNFDISLPSLPRLFPLFAKEGVRGSSSIKLNFNSLIHLTKAPFLHYLRNWDYLAAQRPDHFATICQTTHDRIAKYYRRDSEIIYPPIDTNFFTPKVKLSSESLTLNTPKPSPLAPSPYYLVVSRLVPYKRVGLAIQACTQLGLNLKIAGTGPDLETLKRKTKNDQRPTIEFLGSVSNHQLLNLYQNCTALIMPQEEDFGLVALEAQACGKPVIAYRRGGATETIIDGQTGLFFDHQTDESLIEALQQFNNLTIKQFNNLACRRQALRFSIDNFRAQMRQYVLTKWQEFHHQS